MGFCGGWGRGSWHPGQARVSTFTMCLWGESLRVRAPQELGWEGSKTETCRWHRLCDYYVCEIHSDPGENVHNMYV